ncbi:MAG: hydroxyacylglutathione hydrolase [Polyangiaceae bacterium]|jgi:hydroxyacylglutathione hydrolase
MQRMRIVPIPCLKDNYAYLVICDRTGQAAVVDASEAEPVLAAAKREGVKLSAIWSTHHHLDHVGGNEGVARAAEITEVVGHVSDRGRVPEQTRFVETGDVVKVGSVEARVTHIPGHTLGAVAYFVDDGGQRAVFTGDTLFLAGCGRLFEGTPAQMYASLSSLAALPADTRVFCGHEYTAANLRFAAHVEPSNAAIDGAAKGAAREREAGRPTVPGTLAQEIATNPFLRVRSPEIRRTLGISAGADDVAAFAAIRKAKDESRG